METQITRESVHEKIPPHIWDKYVEAVTYRKKKLTILGWGGETKKLVDALGFGEKLLTVSEAAILALLDSYQSGGWLSPFFKTRVHWSSWLLDYDQSAQKSEKMQANAGFKVTWDDVPIRKSFVKLRDAYENITEEGVSLAPRGVNNDDDKDILKKMSPQI